MARDSPAVGPSMNNIESRAPREFQEAALDTGDLLPSLVWDTGLGTWPSCPVHPRDVPGSRMDPSPAGSGAGGGCGGAAPLGAEGG